MSAPIAVQEAARKAEELHKQFYGEPEAEEPKPEFQKDPDAEDVIANLPGAEEVEEPKEAVEGSKEAVEGSKEEVVEEPKAKDPEVEEAAVPTDNFEHKYKVLQGKYDAEVPALHGQLKQLQSELTSVQSLLANLKQPEKVDESSFTAEKLLSEDEIDEYGPEMIDIIRRAAREEFGPKMARLEKENESLREMLSNVSTTVSESARDNVIESLTSAIPNWREINTDTKFISWLDEREVFSGARRHDLLTQAFENNDAARVIAFFKSYLDENATVQPTAQPAQAPTQEPKVDLMSMAAPGTPKTDPQVGAQKDKRVYTHQEIAAFYRDVQKGLYKNNPAEKEAIERDIIAAGPEGRILR